MIGHDILFQMIAVLGKQWDNFLFGGFLIGGLHVLRLLKVFMTLVMRQMPLFVTVFNLSQC